MSSEPYRKRNDYHQHQNIINIIILINITIIINVTIIILIIITIIITNTITTFTMKTPSPWLFSFRYSEQTQQSIG
jgi:hypothetical protein